MQIEAIMKRFSALVLLIILCSSCSPVQVSPTPTSTPEHTETPVPTATETPPPTLTPTHTLPLVEVECKTGKDVPAETCPFVEDSVLIGRYYLVENFGKDFSAGIKFNIVNDQTRAVENPDHVRGGDFVDAKWTVQMNLANKVWRDYGAEESLYRRAVGIIHEITHVWQYQHGCHIASTNALTDFLVEGQAQFVGLMATGHPELINPAQPGVMWIHVGFVESDWIDSADVSVVAFKDLMDQFSPNEFMNFCDLMLAGKTPRDAFQLAFDLTIQDYRKEFKKRVLGSLADCTQATCGDPQYGQAVVDPVYGTLTDFIDRTLAEPNLIINFIDENGQPAENTILTICKLTEIGLFNCSGGEDRPINSEGQFIRPLQIGIYSIGVCEPGYAENSGNPIKCVYEIKPFEIVAGQVTTIDFQFHKIKNPEGTPSNFSFTLLGLDGIAIPSQYIQICANEPAAEICWNTKTDATGMFNPSLRPGKYLMRLVMPGQGDRDTRGESNPDKYGMSLGDASAEFTIHDIHIKDVGTTEIVFQYPKPNFVINFDDVYGGPILPDLFFWMCKANNPKTINNAQPYVLLKDRNLTDEDATCSKFFGADKTATFKTKLESGQYFIFFNVTRPFYFEPIEYELADISVVSETEVTEITFQPK